MCSLHVFSQFFSILFQVSAHVGSGNNDGSRGLLNEKALVLGFHVTEEEARQLVQEGCGRGGSRTGSRGYLSVEDFVWCFRSRGGLGMKEEAREEDNDDGNREQRPQQRPQHPAVLVRRLIEAWGAGKVSGRRAGSSFGSVHRITGTQLFESMFEKIRQNVAGAGGRRSRSPPASPASPSSPSSVLLRSVVMVREKKIKKFFSVHL